MKKIFFVSLLKKNSKDGVDKKINNQIKAFESLGYIVDYTMISENKAYIMKDGQACMEMLLPTSSIQKSIKTLKMATKYLKKCEHEEYEFIYIRKFMETNYSIRFYKCAKQKNIAVVQEIPTFPYDQEHLSSNNTLLKVANYVDRYFRKKLPKYLSYIATYSSDDRIFGVPTIKIDNGINLEDIKTTPDYEIKDNIINVIGVASMEYWQGYDRLIASLKAYNDEKHDMKIMIHLVGAGTSLSQWKQLSEDLKVHQQVVFYGFKEGEELDAIFAKSQIGFSAIGVHRKGLSEISALKTKEYLARGIPFVVSAHERIVDEMEFCYKIKNDESLINFDDVIQFYINLDKNTLFDKMKKAAKDFSWKSQMKKVTDKIGSANYE